MSSTRVVRSIWAPFVSFAHFSPVAHLRILSSNPCGCPLALSICRSLICHEGLSRQTFARGHCAEKQTHPLLTRPLMQKLPLVYTAIVGVCLTCFDNKILGSFKVVFGIMCMQSLLPVISKCEFSPSQKNQWELCK